jgi:hypothetical protein
MSKNNEELQQATYKPAVWRHLLSFFSHEVIKDPLMRRIDATRPTRSREAVLCPRHQFPTSCKRSHFLFYNY